MADVMERADLKITVSAVQLRPWPFVISWTYALRATGVAAGVSVFCTFSFSCRA